MLDCNACISRCIRTLLADVLRPTQLSRLHPRSVAASHYITQRPPARRGYHSARLTQDDAFNHVKESGSRGERPGPTRLPTTRDISKIDPFYNPPLPSSAEDHHDKKSAQRDMIPSGGLGKPAQVDDAAKSKKRKQLDRELVYLQDPLRLAENTLNLLRKDDNDKALDLVRIASKQIPCTVSWNHIVDYEMSKGRIQKAVKIYNEVFRLSAPAAAPPLSSSR
ncbi:MAG: hypothetical protein Q9223_004106 [Gallowayella weberi]